MNRLGSGDNGEFTFLDIISLTSFFIGVMNLDENLTQGDLQDKTQLILDEVHTHLQQQDEKIDEILRRLNHEENTQND